MFFFIIGLVALGANRDLLSGMGCQTQPQQEATDGCHHQFCAGKGQAGMVLIGRSRASISGVSDPGLSLAQTAIRSDRNRPTISVASASWQYRVDTSVSLVGFIRDRCGVLRGPPATAAGGLASAPGGGRRKAGPIHPETLAWISSVDGGWF